MKLRRMAATIQGRVQGVGYRYFVQRAAQSRRLSGFVRNQPDGSVLVEAQGPESLLQELLQELQFGPSLATVESMHVDWLEPVKTDVEFIIRF